MFCMIIIFTMFILMCLYILCYSPRIWLNLRLIMLQFLCEKHGQKLSTFPIFIIIGSSNVKDKIWKSKTTSLVEDQMYN